jgi:diguanylate cyclase (GGDEF)-like protein/PAS domain S-box-containing protein
MDFGAMDANGDDGGRARRSDDALERWLLATASLLEGIPDAVVAAAGDGRIVFVNTLAEGLFGYPRDELLGEPVQTLWPERVRERYTRNMELYFGTAHGLRFTTEAWGLRRDDSEFVGEMSWGVVETTGGPLLLAIGRDITGRRATEARLRAVATMSERALAGADPWELASDGVELLRDSMPIAGAIVRLSGGATLASHGTVSEPTLRVPIGPGDEFLVAAEGPLADEEVSLVHAVANILATALTRLRNEERMRHEAVHDPLTGLANRTLLRDRLEHALARSERDGSLTGVLFLDLDGFKQVNDAHGHAAGDEVLVELSRNLRHAVRPGDTVARLGGDEFVVVCEDVDESAVVAVADRLKTATEAPLLAGGAGHTLSASIGIALGQDNPDTLMSDADAALYRAKAGGRGGVEFSRRP